VSEASNRKAEIGPLPATRSNRDFDPFYEGIRNRELHIQKCKKCGALQHPPTPMCAECNHLEFTQQLCSTRGKLYSYTTIHNPPLFGFQTPHVVALAEMEDGFRLVAALVDGHKLTLEIGMPLSLRFVDMEDGAVSYRFVSDAKA